MHKADFDTHAPVYDDHFSHTLIGKIYRNIVQDYLLKILPQEPLNILELNCGTGEDALFLASRGHRITAIDISDEMLRVARDKSLPMKPEASPEFLCMDMRQIENLPHAFDLVFSNFGGLNCLPPADLKKVLQDAMSLLKPGGKLILVIMPQYCLWEIFYFFFKFRWGKMFRRKSKQAVQVAIDGVRVNTWYYQPQEIRNMLGSYLCEKLIPVGIALPPPSFSPILENHPGRLKFFKRIEQFLSSRSLFSGIADHYLIDFRKP